MGATRRVSGPDETRLSVRHIQRKAQGRGEIIRAKLLEPLYSRNEAGITTRFWVDLLTAAKEELWNTLLWKRLILTR